MSAYISTNNNQVNIAGRFDNLYSNRALIVQHSNMLCETINNRGGEERAARGPAGATGSDGLTGAPGARAQQVQLVLPDQLEHLEHGYGFSKM